MSFYIQPNIATRKLPSHPTIRTLVPPPSPKVCGFLSHSLRPLVLPRHARPRGIRPSGLCRARGPGVPFFQWDTAGELVAIRGGQMGSYAFFWDRNGFHPALVLPSTPSHRWMM